MYTCTVNWFCVHLYGKLVMYTLVILCTVVPKLILWYLYSKLVFLAMKATLEVRSAKGSVFVCVCTCVGTHFAQSWQSDCTKLACWLHKVYTNFAIHEQLVKIRIIFKLSSSQDPSKCLLKGIWTDMWLSSPLKDFQLVFGVLVFSKRTRRVLWSFLEYLCPS